ncbi:hypothetical protein HGRIS_009475 [Hohenbuehelia grisea]|uniref:Ankyrin n=1 Tax=Hohenbuehelia grisea TaxID=104357 RepID=A0ABR3J1A4_9AGAR
MAEKDATVRLRRAVKENNLFLVKRLVQRTEMRNPDPSTRRYTSLAWAAVLGHEETFEFLLSAGHDDEELSRDSENNTILMLLADYKPPPPDIYAARPSDSDDVMGAALRMARLYYDRYPYILDWSNSQGKTSLHIGALKGNEELVRMLCDLGADFDLSDNKGNSPLHYASSWGHITVVQLLIERGCSYAARNNEGFTASDYAYSFSTRDTLQDTARLQFENNKKARRAVFAQAAEKGNEWGGSLPPPPLGPSNVPNALPMPRMRSGSGNSRTTVTSDGDLDSPLSMPTIPPRKSSLSSSPTNQSSMPSFFHPSRAVHSPKLSSASTTSTFSALAPDPSMLTAPNVASALSPIATRMRERDASAMEKYMNRNRSGSQGTSSTDNRSQNGSTAPSTNGDDIALPPLNMTGSVTPRRLRPSMSAAQLRPTPESPSENSPDGIRSRSGTNPPSARSIMSPPALTRSSSISNSPRTPAFSAQTVFEDHKYIGPPSQYAQFPEPPRAPDHENVTPTAGRRVGFHLLTKPLPVDPPKTTTATHRRGLSATSVRGG